jgi:hypothetical protein
MLILCTGRRLNDRNRVRARKSLLQPAFERLVELLLLPLVIAKPAVSAFARRAGVIARRGRFLLPSSIAIAFRMITAAEDTTTVI